MPSTRNVFLIGRDPNDEDQLTEMLFWLISAVPDAGWELMDMAFGPVSGRGGEFEAVTQQPVPGGYIDGFIEADGYRLIIESKLGSTYGSDQLGKYLRWLATADPDPPVRRSALMTITRNTAPWPHEDRELATKLGIEEVALRWANVHDRLDGFSRRQADDTTESRLISEFLEMLRMEGLVPMAALSDKELETGWGEARATIKHFHEFLKSCRDVAEAIGGQPTDSWNEHTDYAYHEFRLPSEVSITVGLEFSDANYVKKMGARAGLPVLWVQVHDPSSPNWEEAAAELARTPPDGWRAQLISTRPPDRDPSDYGTFEEDAQLK